MATYPPRRLLGARPLPSDPRRDPVAPAPLKAAAAAEGGKKRLPGGRGRTQTERFSRAGRRRGGAWPSRSSAVRPFGFRGGAPLGRAGPLRPRVGAGPVLELARVRGGWSGRVGPPTWGRPACLCLCLWPTPRPRASPGRRARRLSAADLTAGLRSPYRGCGRLARAHCRRPATRCRHLPRSFVFF